MENPIDLLGPVIVFSLIYFTVGFIFAVFHHLRRCRKCRERLAQKMLIRQFLVFRKRLARTMLFRRLLVFRIRLFRKLRIWQIHKYIINLGQRVRVFRNRKLFPAMRRCTRCGRFFAIKKIGEREEHTTGNLWEGGQIPITIKSIIYKCRYCGDISVDWIETNEWI